MSPPHRDVPPPLEGNDQVITTAGTIAWAVALIVLIALRGQLPPADHWWIWTCVAGLALGVFALAYIPVLKRSRARTAARREPAGGGASEDERPGD